MRRPNNLLSRLASRVRRGRWLSAQIVRGFHELYYEAGSLRRETWADTSWMGAPALKCPLDLWIYQEILFEVKPEVIIETGTAGGGSALFLANMCDLIGKGRVVSVDITTSPAVPQHPRIHYLTGSSTDDAVLAQVRMLTAGLAPVLVLLDSDHSRAHVAEEMRLYGPLVTPGSYLIVEDTNVNGHPVSSGFGPGPMEAVDEFLRNNPLFAVDSRREKLLLTFNPRGYLRRDDAASGAV